MDIDGVKCAFAREWTAVFGPTVTVHQQDSVSFLREFPDKIDVLYLDSLDTTEPGHAEHCVKEFEAAKLKLHRHSIVVIDDTPWHAGNFAGKGARLVPHLLDDGCRILYAGYQVVLIKSLVKIWIEHGFSYRKHGQRELIFEYARSGQSRATERLVP